MFHQLSFFEGFFSSPKKTSVHPGKKNASSSQAEGQEQKLYFKNAPVEIQRRAYQRSLNLLLRPNGSLKVTAGRTVSQKVIQKFLSKNSEWIEKNLEQFVALRKKYPPKEYINEEKFLFCGQVHRLKFQEGLADKVEKVASEIIVSRKKDSSIDERALIRRFYEKEAKKLLSLKVQECAERMQLFPSEVRFRSMRSQWGSCSSKGVVTLNWRLVVFPEKLWEYVIVHELAHLQHANHSKKFWRLVEEHFAHYKTCRRYLRDHHYEVDFLGKKSELYFEE